MKGTLLGLLLLFSATVQADERILDFHSDIQIHSDASMTVKETIRVRAEGKNIRRGIYRDFPTTYKTPSGRRHKVDFHIVGVQRDGQREAWHSQRVSNGIRVYFGRKAVLLDSGVYEYRFTYKTNRQLGFFEQHDELYWNVTGNGWAFPIDHASARIQLPVTQVSDIIGEAYTGPQGAKGQSWRWQPLPNGGVFQTTDGLGKHEGLTVVLGWPKGVIKPPDQQEKIRWFVQDNTALVIIWLGSGALLLYYLIAWHFVGRDPAQGVIVPEYEPPTGYSPAALRLIRRMGYDNKALSATLVSLAVKGNLSLQESDNEYTVYKKQGSGQPDHQDEQDVLDSIAGSLVFKKTNHAKVRNLIEAHKKALVDQYRKRYYYANRGWFFPGLGLSFLIAGAAAWSIFHSYGPESIFTLFMAIFVTGFATPFLIQLWRMRERYQRSKGSWFRLIASGIPLLFLYGMFSATDFINMADAMPWPVIIGAVALVLVNALFGYLIKAPTPKGRKLLDKVEGFRQYLSLAEGDELKLRYSEPVTPEKFEAYLPYAIALDVETQWSERFAEDLRKAGEAPGNYRSTWYNGSDFRGVRGIATSVSSSLAASVSSSSTAPGSSSGGGGGGFSGGGGGGGGGGGW